MNGVSIVFNSKDMIYYKNHDSVCQLLGIKSLPRRSTIKLNNDLVYKDDKLDGIYIWFPVMQGCKIKGWKNKISEDENTIYVKPLDKNKDKYKNFMFITFGKFLINGAEKYRFLGVYKYVSKEKKGAMFIKQANTFIGPNIAHSNV